MMTTKWGIVSTGKISHDFTLCLRSLPETHQVVAVAARNFENAKQFAIEHSILKAHKSYEDLAKDPNVEIAYIGNLNMDHFRVSKMMLEAGKHVLCEKPLCMNLKETEELIEVAKRTKKFLMEGIWSRFFPVYEKLRHELAQDTIGRPNLVEVLFSTNAQTIDRVTKKNMGGSAVLDIGVYAIQFASLVFGGEKPQKITANGFVSKEGVDEVVMIVLEYSNERTANLTISIKSVGYNHAFVAGPKGYLRILPPFHAPTVLETPTQKYEIPRPKIIGKTKWENCDGLVYEAIGVRECLQKGLLECPLIPLDESKTISYIMTEVRRQLGIEY